MKSVVGSLILAMASASCGGDSSSKTEDSAEHDLEQNASSGRIDTYDARGVISAVLRNREFVIIKHEEIDSFMEAMTMPFAVRDTSILTGFGRGDSVQFTLKSGNDGIYISAIGGVDDVGQ